MVNAMLQMLQSIRSETLTIDIDINKRNFYFTHCDINYITRQLFYHEHLSDTAMQIVETQLSHHFRKLFLSSCRSLNFIFQPDDETSANAFKCGRRLVTRPAQGDAHLQFESAVNIEILEFTPTNLASHSGRAQSPLRQYYVCMIWDNFHSGRLYIFFYVKFTYIFIFCII